MRTLLVKLIEFYQQYVSPFMSNHCRFTPTCSQYSKVAIIKFGSIKGVWLSLIRLSKCHPWHLGGPDPVPGRPENKMEV